MNLDCCTRCFECRMRFESNLNTTRAHISSNHLVHSLSLHTQTHSRSLLMLLRAILIASSTNFDSLLLLFVSLLPCVAQRNRFVCFFFVPYISFTSIETIAVWWDNHTYDWFCSWNIWNSNKLTQLELQREGDTINGFSVHTNTRIEFVTTLSGN